MIRTSKKLIVTILATTIVLAASIGAVATNKNGSTQAGQTSEVGSSFDNSWDKWCNDWEKVKNNYSQISLTPGSDESKLNFAWYSKSTEPKPKIKISQNKDMSNANNLTVESKDAVKGYISNKATATGLQKNTTYYYSYEINGQWTEAVPYTTKDTDKFSILYVGDPQIGSSGGENAARNDSYKWNNTLQTALKANPKVSFMISAGDQIESGDSKNPSQTYDKNETEYIGYLSPKVLKSLPVATTIGNHDTPSGNYSFHFNNPNASELGKTEAGGDYYYSYGNTLFIVLNTNNSNVAEHKQLIEKAIKENESTKWRVVTLHQDIYGSGSHSNEGNTVKLRSSLSSVFEDNAVDVVLTGHDHTYARSLILKGGEPDSSKLANRQQTSESNTNSTEDTVKNDITVTDPNGILYMTADSSTGSKYYDLAEKQQDYIAYRWQKDAPTYSVINIDNTTFSISTFRTDTGEKIDSTFTITKTK